MQNGTGIKRTTERSIIMVYGAILRKGEGYYTYLKKLFKTINNRQLDYNFLITDCECYPDDKAVGEMLNKGYCFISGEELTKIVEAEDFQWIWGVLSAFDKSVSLSDILKYELPYADGYTGFWENPLTLQHPLALFEIVPWDATLTLILSKDKQIIDDFKKGYPQSEDLTEYNSEP